LYRQFTSHNQLASFVCPNSLSCGEVGLAARGVSWVWFINLLPSFFKCLSLLFKMALDKRYRGLA
jgi:hypothetical protein